MTNCIARTKKDGSPCRRPAGWGTDHVGEGKCKLHGGASPIKHGLYSKYLRGPTRKKYEEFLKATDLKDLSHEIARLRAILAGIDEHNLIEEDSKNIALFLNVIEAIGRMVERKHKIESSEPLVINNSFAIAVLTIVREEVSNEDVILRVAERVEALRPESLHGEINSVEGVIVHE